MRYVLAFALAAASGAVAAATDMLTLEQAQLDRLATLPVGASIVVDAFPDGFGGRASLRFEHIDVYAPGARIIMVTAAGEVELPRSRRIELIGSNAVGDMRASLAYDPGFANVSGVGSAPSGAFVITATVGTKSKTIRAMPATQALPAGITPQIIGSDDGLPSGQPMPDTLAIMLAPATSTSVPRGATVAVDTDNEFMTLRFSNDTAAAASWIADLFGAMDVMYQRDLNVMLQQGTTYLRTTTDPYAQTGSPANPAELNEFGGYWQANYGNVPRAFAALLSGKAPVNSASGIAWINSYCMTQAQGGSYSVHQVFTNPQIDIGLSALLVGHELAHNFGAYHTHCTDVSTGGAPTASNTIDKCFNTQTGCYAGATTSCPTSGPGAPAGTVMSYCNTRGNGCGPTGQNVLQFHPVQISVLSTLIAQNTPSCLSAVADEIFLNGFD